MGKRVKNDLYCRRCSSNTKPLIQNVTRPKFRRALYAYFGYSARDEGAKLEFWQPFPPKCLWREAGVWGKVPK